MDYLYTRKGLQRLEDVVRPGMLCVFDFDGTLAPIVRHPEDAGMAPEMAKALADLARLTPVAILTGRSVADLQERLSVPVAYVIGNHGMEGLPGWEVAAQRYQQHCQIWTTALTPLASSGVRLENKRYSLSVHYRGVTDAEAIARQLQDAFAALDPQPRVVAGKCVFNLVPEDAPDKGGAIQALLQISGAATALFVGDDVTDEDVFRLALPQLLSVRIEPSPDSAAPFFLHDQGEMLRLVQDLTQRLRQNDQTVS